MTLAQQQEMERLLQRKALTVRDKRRLDYLLLLKNRSEPEQSKMLGGPPENKAQFMPVESVK